MFSGEMTDWTRGAGAGSGGCNQPASAVDDPGEYPQNHSRPARRTASTGGGTHASHPALNAGTFFGKPPKCVRLGSVSKRLVRDPGSREPADRGDGGGPPERVGGARRGDGR